MAPKQNDDTVGEEVSAFGQRVKGAAKDAAGAVTGNRSLEREGERENAEGRARQASNDVMDETDGVRGTTVTPRSSYVTGLYDSPESASRAYQAPHEHARLRRRRHRRDDDRRDPRNGTSATSSRARNCRAARRPPKGSAPAARSAAASARRSRRSSPSARRWSCRAWAWSSPGPIAAALAGAGAGGATGGIIGALIGAGIPEERAVAYDRGLKQGGILIGTRARDEREAGNSNAISACTAAARFGGNHGTGLSHGSSRVARPCALSVTPAARRPS